MYLLVPPTVNEAPGMDVAGPLFGRVAYPRGVSLLVTGTRVREQRWPTIEQQRAADTTYLGGHEYLLTDAQAQVLIDAGYESCLTKTDAYGDTYEDGYSGSDPS